MSPTFQAKRLTNNTLQRERELKLFDKPWKITKLVESTHNLNVNLVYVNN